MTDSVPTIYSRNVKLSSNNHATAAAVDMITKACAAGDETYKTAILEWASEGDNLKKLRDKIIECAKEE